MLVLRFLILACLFSLTAPVASGQDWVKAMFEEASHDFGNVPRGANAEYRFKLVNKYEEDVHIADVRTSCVCTKPRRGDKVTLKTYEEGEIICAFDTRSFIGARAAVVTVVFDRPYYGEMQLSIKGNIRSDIVTDPGEIQFGEVDRGDTRQTTVKINYVGDKAWQIEDVRSANKHLSVTLGKAPSPTGGIGYVMDVRLKETAPAGPFNDQIVLVTNDTEFNLVTVPVRGKIVPPLVMPVSVDLGTISPESVVSRRIVIKGKNPFEIKDIVCSDERFEFTVPTGMKIAHIVPVQFKADGKEGAFKKIVKVVTSLQEDNTATTIISGNVNAGP